MFEMEIESVMFCSCMKSPTILYFFDTCRKEIRFYAEPHLYEGAIKHVVKLKKVPDPSDPEKYGVLIYCPVCGKPLPEGYGGVPMDWECLASPGALVVIPLDQIPDSWIIAKSGDV